MVRLSLALSLLFFTACDGSKTPPTDEGTGPGDSGPVEGGDEDQDGFAPSEGDCDDGNALVFPGAEETCNGIDDNCDAEVDEGVLGSFYQDYDADGFGNPDVEVVVCDQPDGYVSQNTDCDDNEPDSHPGADEVCDEIDNNCDGAIDEGLTFTWYVDVDVDGFGDPATAIEACEAPEGTVGDNTDCDDTTSSAYPGNAEVCDEIDNNCDGAVDEGVATTYYADFDSDGFGTAALTQDACAVPTGYTVNSDDCDDAVAAVNPSATETCNTVDDDCDGTTDEDDASGAGTWYADADADGFGDRGTSHISCLAPTGYVADATDCDDGRALTNPSATEYCNSFDDDCDGTTDENAAVDAPTWYLDADGDDFGNAAVAQAACTQPSGYVADATDCSDASARVFPGAPEYCDTLDNDCDGTSDEDTAVDARTWYADADADTHGNPSVSDVECYQPTGYVASATDCDDARAASYPGAPEYCNSYDDDCDGAADEESALDARTWYADSDADTYGNPSRSDVECYAPTGYVANATDCDDTRALSNPGATEYCNTYDDDCDGSTDEDAAADASTWYLDSDRDRYGNASITDVACYQPTGYVSDATDCNDAAASAYPGATEYCDTLDNDCDGSVDEDEASGAGTWYRDADADSYGNASVTDIACYQPTGYVANATDCNDGRAASYPGAHEYCNSY
ncbi:MAG: putative metal-binding motif-containing protein, partial [Myxococcota bacterium]